MQRPEIQQRLVDAAFTAGAGQFSQRAFAGRKVEMPSRVHANEFVDPDDLKLGWHVIPFCRHQPRAGQVGRLGRGSVFRVVVEAEMVSWEDLFPGFQIQLILGHKSRPGAKKYDHDPILLASRIQGTVGSTVSLER